MPETPEGACSCSAAAVVVAWLCVGFAVVVAVLSHAVLWTAVAIAVLVVAIAGTLGSADRLRFRADSLPPTGLGEDDERVGSR